MTHSVSRSTDTDPLQRSDPNAPAGRPTRRIAGVVAASLATGLVAGVLLVFAPFIPADESGATGAILCGFAIGWAVLTVLSVRFTDQPQRWAAAPALFTGLAGLLLIAFGSTAQQALTWVWPPALLALTVVTTVRARRRLHSTSARVLLYPVLAILAVASVGGGAETVLEAYDASHYPMPGQLIDVDGHRMHLRCTGTGSPTVVLEPGGGDMASTMAWIAPAVARDTRVCVYDRPGRGWSDPVDVPQDGTRVADDLHTLLHNAHVPGPYVLAGHSFGGLYVLAYAAHYPADVAGMVLIDSTAPTSPAPRTDPPAGRNDVLVRAAALVSIASRIGLGRLYALTSYGELPSPAREEVRASISTPATLRSTIDEYVQGSTSMQEAAELRSLGDIPLFVLTAGSGSAETWFANQDKLARLSTNSAHRVVDGATHEMLVADQTAAASTVTAIRDVVSSVRTGTPLSR
ncbi:MAG: alpha/beta fold hydrolase [Kineosporiaceae bacterium]